MSESPRPVLGEDWLPQLLVLPFRMLSFGLGMMTQTASRLAELATPAGLSWTPAKTRSASTSISPAPPPSLPPAFSASTPPPTTASAGSASSTAAVANSAPTPLKEERTMSSCGCSSNDLSGCDVLKVVQFTIVTVNPYINDNHRILAGPYTVGITSDMSDSDFTAFAIAYAEQETKRPRERDVNPATFQLDEYLRVCYSVVCRMNMPCPNYEKQQAEVLAAINRTLRVIGLKEEGGDKKSLDKRSTGG